MSEGLEASERLERIKGHFDPKSIFNKELFNEDFEVIERKLKTLEIIKKFVWVEDGEIHLGLYADSEIILSENDFETQEEYDLLKSNL